MKLSPPKNSTFYISMLLAVVGIILGFIGFFMIDPFGMLFGGLALSEIMIIVGLILGFLGWLLLALGVSKTGF